VLQVDRYAPKFKRVAERANSEKSGSQPWVDAVQGLQIWG